MEENFTFYDRIKDLAKSKGISIKKLERDLGMAENSAKKWKDHAPGSEALKKLASYFDVSTDYLLGIAPDDETIRMAEELRRSPGMRMMFDSVKDYDDSEKMKVAEFIMALKK